MEPWTPPEKMISDLRHLLNEWDPIGIADLVADEYDCLIDPLLERLRDGSGRREVEEFLRHEVTDHFGLEPVLAEIGAVAERLVEWWAVSGRAESQAATGGS